MKLTPNQFKQTIKANLTGDPYYDHIATDTLMEELLSSLGYEDGIKLIRDMERNYETHFIPTT